MQYRPHRYNTQYPVELETSAGSQKGSVIDVNNVGARIEGIKDIHRGDKVKLTILSAKVDALVQWASEGRVGITFRPQITDDQVDTLRYRRDARHGQRHSTVGFGLQEMR